MKRICGMLLVCALNVCAQSVSLETILKNSGLWGNDFSPALANLSGWSQIGERGVAFYPDRVAGTVPYKTREEAQEKAKDLAAAVQPGRFHVENFLSIDDDAWRISLTAPGLQLLAAQLSSAQVEKLIGPPESVRVQLIQGETDRRPVDLTLRSYAGGKVIFIETDIAPRPGFVDRVIFDLPALLAAVAKEGL
jgi:hypothetical protein